MDAEAAAQCIASLNKLDPEAFDNSLVVEDETQMFRGRARGPREDPSPSPLPEPPKA